MLLDFTCFVTLLELVVFPGSLKTSVVSAQEQTRDNVSIKIVRRSIVANNGKGK